jgi:hypothetical protein
MGASAQSVAEEVEAAMRSQWKLVLAVLACILCPWTAQAGWGIGVSVGVPVYPRPWCGYPYYYRPYYPYYVVPPPVVVAAPPVVQAVPVAPTYAPPAAAPSAVADARPGDADKYLLQLNDPDQQTRIDAIVQLGRLKSKKAIDPLTRILASDRSPPVREAAARALGMIGAPGGLGALQRAASADDNQEVRQSAQFAAEIIRASLQRPQ